MHDKVRKPDFQTVGKFSADKSVSHHVKAQQEASDSQLERTHCLTNAAKNHEQHYKTWNNSSQTAWNESAPQSNEIRASEDL